MDHTTFGRHPVRVECAYACSMWDTGVYGIIVSSKMQQTGA